MLKIALFAGAGYLAYKQGWLSMFGIGTPGGVPAVVPTVPPGTPVVTPPVTPPIANPNTIAAIQGRVLAAAKAPSEGLGVDAWGWYLNNELGPLGKTAPDPISLFPAGFDRSTLVPAAQYWAVMEPALKAQGLSGYGLMGLAGYY